MDKGGRAYGALGKAGTRPTAFFQALCGQLLFGDHPQDERRSGVVLYLHGGGYTCGSLEYAKGFAATLASQCGVRVFCAAYRLAPENPYPAAVDDALEAYRYLLKKGYAPQQILLCGEAPAAD